MRAPILLALASAALLAGCGSSTPTPSTGSAAANDSTTATRTPSTGSPSTKPASTTKTTSTTARGPSALQVAQTFAAAYAHYLDGDLPAGTLPDASAQVHAQAGQLMPTRARAGLLAVQSVAQVPGGSTFIAQLADHAHRFTVQVTVVPTAGRPLVVGVVPPDFDSLLAPPARPIPQPAGSSAPAVVARAFLRGYLPWLYGQGPLKAIKDATPALRAQLKAHPPNIPPSMQGLHPRLAALGMQRQGAAWRALANATDGRETFDLTLTVTNTNRRWLISAVTSPQ